MNSLTLGIRILSILLLQGGFLHMGDLFLIFSRTEGSQSCFLYLISHQLFRQFSSVAQSCLTLCDPMNCSTPGLSWSSLKLMCIKSVMPSSHRILCRPLFLLPLIPPSIRVFFNESTLRMRWPKKVLEFQLQHQSCQ